MTFSRPVLDRFVVGSLAIGLSGTVLIAGAPIERASIDELQTRGLACMTAEAQTRLGEDLFRWGRGPAADAVRGLAIGSDYRVRVLYFIPSNRAPQPEYEERIDVGLKLIQTYYRNHMEMAGNGPKTFGLELNQAGKVVTNLYFAPETDAFYRGTGPLDLWNRVRAELDTDPVWGDTSQTVLLVFVEAQVINPDGTVLGGVTLAMQDAVGAQGWGGLALLDGSAVTYLSPYMFPDTALSELGEFEPAYCGGYLGFQFVSRSVIASAKFGAVAHELGHVFGLLHDFRFGDNGLMANGFRRFGRAVSPHLQIPFARLSGCDAALLNLSRFFNESSVFTDDTGPDVTVTDPPAGSNLPFGMPVSLEAVAADSGGAGLALAIYMRTGTTNGCLALTGDAASPSFSFPPVPAGTADYGVAVLDAHANRGPLSQDAHSLTVSSIPSGSDLVSTDVCYDPPESLGGQVDVRIYWQNTGNAATTGSHRTDWYRDVPVAPTTTEPGDLSSTMTTIFPNVVVSESVGSFSYSEGTLQTAIQVDVFDTVSEFVEGAQNVLYPVLYGNAPCHESTEVSGLRLTRNGAADIILEWNPSSGACHRAYKVFEAMSPRPDVAPGTFPFDPIWNHITGSDSDLDPTNTSFAYTPPATDRYYLVLSEAQSGYDGPVGHF